MSEALEIHPSVYVAPSAQLFGRAIEPEGRVRYTGWFRKLADTDRVLYTGFYMHECVPDHDGACVKVVFPMPDGNATVILRQELGPGGELRLDTR